MKNTFGHVLVTGGAGFIGSRLLRKLLPISQSVTVIDDCSTSRRENLPVSERLTFIEASYVDEQLLERVLPRTTHIYHLACRNLVKSAQNMDDDLHVNLYGGYLLLKKKRRKPARTCSVSCIRRQHRFTGMPTFFQHPRAVTRRRFLMQPANFPWSIIVKFFTICIKCPYRFSGCLTSTGPVN